jgi:hypothetical protein
MIIHKWKKTLLSYQLDYSDYCKDHWHLILQILIMKNRDDFLDNMRFSLPGLI